MKYKSELINEIVENEGHCSPTLHYESECVETWIEETKGAYPKLCDYESEWLNYYLENDGIGKFPYLTLDNITSTTIENSVPIPFKSAILKGNTGYRDIETGEILEVFEDGRNLELVSVKMPVLTTSNEDGTKTNILTVNEPVELRGIGEVKDTLDLMTGEVRKRICEVVLDGSLKAEGMYNKVGETISFYFPVNTIQLKSTHNEDVPKMVICDKLRVGKHEHQWVDGKWLDKEFLSVSADGRIGIRLLTTKASTKNEFHQYLSQNPITVQYQSATESVKTVDLSIIDESGNSVSELKAMNGITHIETTGTPLNPTFSGEIPVEAITQNLESFIEEG